MDLIGVADEEKGKRVCSDDDATDEKKKRVCSNEDDAADGISQRKRSCPSPPIPTIESEDGYVTEVVEPLFAESLPQLKHLFQHVVPENLFAELWPQIEHLFRKVVPERFDAEFRRQIVPLIRKMVDEEVKSTIQSQILPLLLLRQKSAIGKGVTTGHGTLMEFKLCFRNQIASPIFTNNEIKAKNGEPLKVEICNFTHCNAICPSPLLSAQIEFFILDGNFGSGQRHDETNWTLSDFNTSVQSPRDRRPPLIIGTGLKLYLENGVGFIQSVIVTDNSSWMRSKMFRLGAKIIDEKILAEFSRIGEAVSEPFRVMDHRGEVNKKHHPPSKEDEVWRLEGIGKDGVYHKNLSNHGIKNVGLFLKAYKEDSASLRKLLGNRVSDKTWNMMVNNVKECDLVPTYGRFNEQNHLDDGCSMEEVLSKIDFRDSPQSLPPYGEVSTPL